MNEKTSAMLMAWFAVSVICSLACGSAANPDDDDERDCFPTCQGDAVCIEGRCEGGSTPVEKDPDLVPLSKEGNPSDGQSWTLLIYMIADNNLEIFGMIDLMEMMAVGSNDRFNIIVQADRAQGHFASDPEIPISEWTSTKRFRVERGQLVELDDLGEVNMGEGRVLSDFVSWGLSSYPADRVGLIMWDHGGGWANFGGDESHSSDVLSMSEIRAGLDDAFAKTGTKRLALLGFDACLMGNYEVARLMRPYAHYMMASEELEPGVGWEYTALADLASNPSQGPEAFGRSMIPAYKKTCDLYEQGGDVTLSMIDLNKLSELDVALNKLADAVESSSAQSTLLRARSGSLSFAKNANPKLDRHLVDLGDLVKQLAQGDASFNDERDAVLSALNSVVINKINGPATQAATGLSAYLPSSASYYDNAYSSLGAGGRWSSMVAKMAGISVPTGEQPEFINPDDEAYLEQSQGQLIVAGQLAPGTTASVVNSRLYVGLIADQAAGQVLLLADINGAVNMDNDLVVSAWSERMAVLKQGELQSYAYLSATRQGAYDVYTIPMAYVERPGEQAQLAVLNKVYDPAQGSLISQGIYLSTEGGYGELTAAPGSKLYPLALLIENGQSQWQPLDEEGFDAQQALDIFLTPPPAGSQFLLMLEAQDAVGNNDVVTAIQSY